MKAVTLLSRYQYSWQEKNDLKKKKNEVCQVEGEIDRKSGGFAESFDWKSADKASGSWDLALKAAKFGAV